MASPTDLGINKGKVYVTDHRADLTVVSPYNSQPIGHDNTAETLLLLRRKVFPANSPSTHGSFAMATVAFLSASNVNLTDFTIDGVAQIAGSVAMTSGDIIQSAIDTATAINAHTASPDWRATARDGVLFLQCLVPGSAQNGLEIILSFDDPGTDYNATLTTGGMDVGMRPYRIFINPSETAPADSLVGSTEITEQVSHRDISSPPLVVNADISGEDVIFTRTGNDARVVVDGSTGSGTVENIVIAGIQDGDRVTFVGKVGSTAPAFTSNALLLLERDVTLDPGVSLTVWFSVDAAVGGAYVQDSASRFDAATFRANDIPLPAQPGVYTLTPAAGTATITPGSTGVSAFPGIVYDQSIGLIGGPVVLGASLAFVINAANAVEGDFGYIYGNARQITVGANAVTFADASGVLATLSPELALSGQWAARWEFIGTISGIDRCAWTILPNFSLTNTGFINTPWVKDGAITNPKIAAGIDGVKLLAGSVPTTAFDAATQYKVNALNFSNVVSVANIIAADRQALWMDCTAGALVVTLPAAGSGAPFMEVRVSKTDASVNGVTVSGNGNTINGAATDTSVAAQYDQTTFTWNGAEWFAK